VHGVDQLMRSSGNLRVVQHHLRHHEIGTWGTHPPQRGEQHKSGRFPTHSRAFGTPSSFSSFYRRRGAEVLGSGPKFTSAEAAALRA
jgi:hypothetical protein